MICLGTWWKMWKELDALSVKQSGHKFFCSEVNNEGKNILSSTYEILVAFCFCSRITMISVNNLFFIFFDVKRTGEGQPAFLLDIYHCWDGEVLIYTCASSMSTDKTGAPDCLKRWSLMVKWKFDREWQLSGDTLFSQHFTFEKYPKSFIGDKCHTVTSQTHSAHTFWTRLLYMKEWLFSVIINI